jgi:hypothetical protein
MEKQLRERREGLVCDLDFQFKCRLDLAQISGLAGDVLLEIRQLLNAARYINGLLRDLRAD